MTYLLRRVGRREVAEDLLQETFLRAMDAGSFHEGNLRAYLLRIAHNLNVNRLRRPSRVIADSPAVDAHAGPALPGSTSPERAAVWSSFARELRKELDEMPPGQRKAFEMGVVQQRSYAEIARLTGWKPSTVKVKVWRARRTIIDRLGKHLTEMKGF
jgi:RNA polymerase sigma-70 factor (ECF subfamily)